MRERDRERKREREREIVRFFLSVPLSKLKIPKSGAEADVRESVRQIVLKY